MKNWLTNRSKDADEKQLEITMQESNEYEQTEENITIELKPNELTILIGTDLVPFSSDIGSMIRKTREEIMNFNGFRLPLINVKDDSSLQENEYRILVRHNLKYIGFAIPNKNYAIPEIKTNLKKVCKENLSEIFSTKFVEEYINNHLCDSENYILKVTILEFFTITSIKKILVYLLENNLSIKDGEYIFEKMCEYASLEKDKCYFRDPVPIAKMISEEIEQNNRQSVILESYLGNF